MAKAAMKSTGFSDVDDEKQYRVKLKKVVLLGDGSALTPTTDNVIRGDFLKTVSEDAIDSYEEV